MTQVGVGEAWGSVKETETNWREIRGDWAHLLLKSSKAMTTEPKKGRCLTPDETALSPTF